MTRAIVIHEFGGPDRLTLEDVVLGDPGAGEVRIRHTAIGLNYIDVYHRTGLYPRPLPLALGVEAAGVVEQLGPDVGNFAVGDRVAYVLEPGSYSEARNVGTQRLIKLPDNISDEIAAASLLKGLTAHFLLHRTYKVQPGDSILIHAAAGGVGLLVCQWAKYLGAKVFGTVSSRSKADLAEANGCDRAIIVGEEDFVEVVKNDTGGKGLAAVYDSVGKDTFLRSLDCLKDFGTLILFGQASGPVEPFDPNILQRGSFYVTRPTLVTHAAHRDLLEESSQALFARIADGTLDLKIGQRFPLEQVAEAHRALEARETIGSSVLTV